MFVFPSIITLTCGEKRRRKYKLTKVVIAKYQCQIKAHQVNPSWSLIIQCDSTYVLSVEKRTFLYMYYRCITQFRMIVYKNHILKIRLNLIHWTMLWTYANVDAHKWQYIECIHFTPNWSYDKKSTVSPRIRSGWTNCQLQTNDCKEKK